MVALSFGLHLPPAVSGPALLSGNNSYISRGDLDQAIEFCRANRRVIVGMEGVTTDGAAIVPAIEFIADLGDIDGQWHDRVLESCDAARLISSRWGGLSGFDFVELEIVGRTEQHPGPH